MAQTILYYPTINIPDGAWLRNALLYWENISSISPFENYPGLSSDLLYLQNNGIYKPIYPEELFSSNYASEFTHSIISKLEQYKKRFEASESRNHSGTSVKIHRNKIYAPALHELIHFEKISPDLHQYLSEERFIKDFNCEGWMEIDTNIASIYMRTLAEYIVKCHSEDVVLGTNKCQHQNHFYTRTRPGKKTTCISLSLDNCLPQPSPKVSFEDLLDFKKQHYDDLLEFRKKLRAYEQSLSECCEIEEMKSKTEQFKESWQAALLKEQKLFTKEKISFSLGTLYTLINIPATAESIINAIHKLNPTLSGNNIMSNAILSGAAAITLGYKYVNHKNKINEQRSSSGFSYILKASRSKIISSL